MVTTVHGFSGANILPAYLASPSHYVSISDSDRAAGLHYDATIHHGIDLSGFEPVADAPADGHLVIFGRIHPDKGTADAIEIARRAGKRLVICGPVQDAEYFAARVEPRLGPDVEYRGSVGPADRSRILGGAAVLLHPIAFAEPFGLSVVEAMASPMPRAAPVIATVVMQAEPATSSAEEAEQSSGRATQGCEAGFLQLDARGGDDRHGTGRSRGTASGLALRLPLRDGFAGASVVLGGFRRHDQCIGIRSPRSRAPSG
jgi:hypothetical protein